MNNAAERRLTPYELAFGRESLDDRLFPPIAEEAEARGHPLHDPDRFLFLGSVGRLLRAVAGGAEDEDAAGAGVAGEAGAAGAAGAAEATGAAGAGGGAEGVGVGEQMRQHGRLLFHAFHHWRAGRVTRAIDADALRRLIEEVTGVGDWRLTVPAPAGYLQLPRNRVWAAPAEALQPEPVDGFFWTLLPEGPPALHLLLALGVRPDRPGFSVVPATGVPDGEPHWAGIDARPDGTDFETTLPGGELDRLYSIETAAEILKLASLCFWRLDPAGG